MSQNITTDPQELSFEEAMAELNIVVAKLERGQAGLEESVDLYERGLLLKQRCEAQLQTAKLRVEKLLPAADGTGEVKTVPLDRDGSAH